MTEILPLPEAIAQARRRRRLRRARGLHAPHPVRGGPRTDPAGPQGPAPRAHDARPHLRPADRRGCGAQAHFFLGRQSRRRLAAPPARRGRECLAAAPRDRRAQPRGHGGGLPRGRRAPAVRDAARLHRHRPAAKNPRIKNVTCPYTGEKIATVPAVNPDVTILHAQRADRRGNVAIDGIVGAAREAASQRPSSSSQSRRSSTSSAGDEQCRPAELTVTAVSPARRRLAVVCARLLRARQRLLPPLGRHRARARTVHGLDRPPRSRHRRPPRVPREPSRGCVIDASTARVLRRRDPSFAQKNGHSLTRGPATARTRASAAARTRATAGRVPRSERVSSGGASEGFPPGRVRLPHCADSRERLQQEMVE